MKIQCTTFVLSAAVLSQVSGHAIAGSPTITYRESSRTTLLKITTEYNTPVDASKSVTQASASASTIGSACWTDTADFDFDSDPSPGNSPDHNASASASDTLYTCNPTGGGGCVASSASSIVGCGLSADYLKSTISVTTSVVGSSVIRSEGCPGCEYQATGMVGGSFVAAWAQGASGSIDNIEVKMSMNFETETNTTNCLVFSGGSPTGLASSLLSDEFTSVTIEYFDSSDASLGSDTLQGVIFTDIDEMGDHNISIHGELYDDPSIGGPLQYPCPIGTQCEKRNVTVDFTPPAGTAYAVYTGETLNTGDFDYMDVNLDGVIDYFDRVEVALSFGLDVDDLAYLPWADLTRDGDIDSSDGAVLDAVNCIADLNDDGVIDSDDSDIFLAWYNSVDPADNAKADLTGDGTLNYFDVAAFLDMMSTGCS